MIIDIICCIAALLFAGHMMVGQCELNSEPMQSDTRLKVSSENDKGPVKETPI